MYCRNCGRELNEHAVVCVGCGAKVGSGTAFCYNCGSVATPEAGFCMNCGVELKKAIPTSISKRNIAAAIVFSIITCGIYALYWFVKITDEMNLISGNEKETSGGISLLLSIVTCGIYSYFWAYRMGEKRDSLDDKHSMSGVLYLVLSLFGFLIIPLALMQNAINDTVDNNK